VILQAIFNHGSIENPSVPIGSGWDFGQSNESAAGVHISRDGAMKLSAFWRGVNLRSDYIARLPLEVKLKTDRGKAPDTDHPAYSLLMYQPNPEVNAFTLKKTAEHHQIVSGNGYIYILRRGSGAPAELWNLDPDNTWPVRVNGRLSYVTRIDYGEGRREMRNLLKEDVIHLKGLGWDGLCGYPFLRVMANTLGLSTAANEYAARFFRNNAEPRVVIEMPGPMPQDAQTQFIEQWNKMHQGLESAHRTAIITGGGKVSPFSINASDAQLLDQRKFSLVEIANGLGMPPHKVGASDRIAYNSLEQENQAFADDTLEPRMSEWEQELHNKLLTEREKMLDTHCIRFDRNELVRADLVARATAMEKAVKGPWMTPDEARSGEGLSPYPGPEGDKLLIPEKPEPKAPSEPEKPEPEEDDDEPAPKTGANARNSHESLLLRTCNRLAKRIAAQATNKAKDQRQFMDFVDRKGVETLRSGILDELEAVCGACADVGVSADVELLVSKIVDGAQSDLFAITTSVTAQGLVGAVEEWGNRFTGATMEGIVREVFTRGKAA
jgi:HK97 family phage portal protein